MIPLPLFCFLLLILIPFVYAVQIGAVALALHHPGHLTLEQAEDLLQFLLGLTDMDYRAFQTYYQHDTIF